MGTIPKDIADYHRSLTAEDRVICELLAREIGTHLEPAAGDAAGTVTAKVWHRHPVWFIDGNPIAGYSRQKKGIRLMFWSGAGFDEAQLDVRGEKFKDASVFYNSADEIDTGDLKRWLEKSKEIQWDYKNLVKRKGVLERLK